MNNYTSIFEKMYYLPVIYYWLNNNSLYDNAKENLKNILNKSKKYFYQKNIRQNIKSNKQEYDILEKTCEYNEYKSALIRVILIEHAHNYPNCNGASLVTKIMDVWKKNDKIKDTIKEYIYERTIHKITQREKDINNIEDILMLINLRILENYYR